jgi:hypothetical protein
MISKKPEKTAKIMFDKTPTMRILRANQGVLTNAF